MVDVVDRTTIEQFTPLDGPNIRVSALASFAGISKTKAMDDNKRGEFAILKVRCGTRWMGVVKPEEARRYLMKLFNAGGER